MTVISRRTMLVGTVGLFATGGTALSRDSAASYSKFGPATPTPRP